jgi:hypothetical protein
LAEITESSISADEGREYAQDFIVPEDHDITAFRIERLRSHSDTVHKRLPMGIGRLWRLTMGSARLQVVPTWLEQSYDAFMP